MNLSSHRQNIPWTNAALATCLWLLATCSVRGEIGTPNLQQSSSMSSCSSVQPLFKMASEPLVVHDAESAKKYEKLDIERQTGIAAGILLQAVTENLSKSAELPASAIVDLLNCVQNTGEYPNWAGFTNSPFAMRRHIDGRDIVFVAFWIYRGYSAVPDMRPYIFILERGTKGWRQIEEAGAELTGHTFYLTVLQSDKAGVRLLWYGNRIGDTGTRLSAQVAEFDSSGFRIL